MTEYFWHVSVYIYISIKSDGLSYSTLKAQIIIIQRDKNILVICLKIVKELYFFHFKGNYFIQNINKCQRIFLIICYNV